MTAVQEPQPASLSPAPEQAGNGRLKRIRKASTATDAADVMPSPALLCLLSTKCLTAALSCSLRASCPRHANLDAYLQAPQAAELIDADGPDSAVPPTDLLQVC